ncbi:phage tail tape measure protein [Helicobacter sp. 11S03491-1]|uniref:phage tail tape measure protein n=1 Tax=Helicobacter sp. 11S03491-1 TaxID=1476196 RepID=UPI000BA69E10|nr:phage tail tape measure protein [Helicobacter sp. 11S03491-1]PAF41810.1 phage tail tape measure protein [Helicobacter sp. 11S03491-1]
MGLKSDITLNLGADFEEITKGMRIFNKKTGESLTKSLDLGLTKSIAKFKEELGVLKTSSIMPTDQFAKVNEMAKRIRDATRVKLEIDMSHATKAIDGLRYQILGTYASFKGLISKPLSLSIDFNNALNDINAFANLSSKELENLKKDMWDLGKNNGVRMNDILKTTELSAQLGVAKEELKDFSQLALNMQVGLKLGMEESVNTISKISKAFHLNTKELSVFSDEVSAMALSTKTSAKAILEVTNTTLSGAKAFGLSAKETSALSASFLSVGLDSSEASSSINKFFTELNNIDHATDGFKRSLAKMGLDAEQLKEDIQSNPQEAIKNLFEDLNNLEDEERFGVISELFGKKMANNIHSAKDGVKAFNLALESTKDSSGALQKAVDRVAGDGFGDLVISLGNSFKHLGVSIGNGFVPVLGKIFSGLKIGVEWLSELFDNYKGVMKYIAGGIVVLVGLKSAMLGIMMLGNLKTLVFYPLQYSIAFLTNGVGLYNLALARKSFLTKIATIRTNALTFATKAHNFTLKAISFSLDFLNKKLRITNIIKGIATGITYAYNTALLILNTTFKALSIGINLFARGFKIAMFSIKGALISTGIGALFVALGAAVYLVMKYWEPIKAFFKGLFQGIAQGMQPLKDSFIGLWNSLKTAFDPLAPLFSKIWNVIKLIFKPIGMLFNLIFGDISNTGEELSGFAQTGLVIGKVIGGIVRLIAYPFEMLIKAITTAVNLGGKVTGWLAGIFGGDDKKIEVEANKNSSISLKGSIDETLAKQNENKAKMLNSIANNQTHNSRVINDYKNITINTNTNAQEITRAINSYSYDDDKDF